MCHEKKLNTKISMGAELVDADYTSILILWTKIILGAKRYKVEKIKIIEVLSKYRKAVKIV